MAKKQAIFTQGDATDMVSYIQTQPKHAGLEKICKGEPVRAVNLVGCLKMLEGYEKKHNNCLVFAVNRCSYPVPGKETLSLEGQDPSGHYRFGEAATPVVVERGQFRS